MLNFTRQMNQESRVKCKLHLGPEPGLPKDTIWVHMKASSFQERYPPYITHTLLNAVQENQKKMAAATALSMKSSRHTRKFEPNSAVNSGKRQVDVEGSSSPKISDKVHHQHAPSASHGLAQQHTPASVSRAPTTRLGNNSRASQQPVINRPLMRAPANSNSSAFQGGNNAPSQPTANGPNPIPNQIQQGMSAARDPNAVVNLAGIAPFRPSDLPPIRKTGKIKEDGSFDGMILNNHYNAFRVVKK